MFHELFLSLRRLGITMLVYYVMAVNKRFLMIENKGVGVCVHQRMIRSNIPQSQLVLGFKPRNGDMWASALSGTSYIIWGKIDLK